MKKFSLLVLLLLIVAACGGISDDTIQDKKEEVMEIHDRAMAKMGAISKLQKEIGSLQESEGDTAGILASAKADLRNAHNLMMEWMKDFSNTYDETWHGERKIEFLTEEKEKMAEIERKMNKAIEAAENTLKEHRAKISDKDTVAS